MNWRRQAQAEPAGPRAAASVAPAASWPLQARARLPGLSSLLPLQRDVAPGMANSPAAKPAAAAAPMAPPPDPVPAS